MSAFGGGLQQGGVLIDNSSTCFGLAGGSFIGGSNPGGTVELALSVAAGGIAADEDDVYPGGALIIFTNTAPMFPVAGGCLTVNPVLSFAGARAGGVLIGTASSAGPVKIGP